ncbi:MAG: hypothetical protein IKR13_06480, partial [Victivallales bacterium]|nr:hypothetical protein [Victivallales bacterium]
VLLAGALLLQLPGVFFRHRALKRLDELAASWTLPPAPEQERWEQLAQDPAYKMLKRGWSKIADDKIISHEEAISNKRFAEFDEDNQIYYCQEILPFLPEPNEVRKLLDSARGTPEYRDLTKNLERALRHMISIHLYVAEDVASSEEFWELLLDILEERGNGNYGRLEKQFFGDWFTTLCECSKGLEMMMETNALTLEQNHRLRELLETGRSSASRLIQHEEQIMQMTGTDILFRLMWQGRGGHWGLYDGDYIPLRDCCAVTPGLLWMIARTASKFQALNSTTFDSWQEGYRKSTFWNTCILEDFFADILVGSLYDMEEVFSNIDCRLDLLQEALTLHEQYLATGEWSQTTQADSLAITCGPETFIVHTELWPGNKVSDGSGCCDYEGEVSEGEDWFLVDWEKYERQKEEEDRRDERKALEAPREKEFETLRIHHPRLEKDDDFVIRIGFR